MARPRKDKIVCKLPQYQMFGTKGPDKKKEPDYIVMTVEEYESIRLMDYEGLTQEQSASKMEIGRSTFQRIYDDARKKVANSMVEGNTIVIDGGDYIICREHGKRVFCNQKGCGFRQELQLSAKER